MLSNAYFLAKFRFDTAENEPAKNLQNFRKCIFEKCIFEKCIFENAFSKNAFFEKCIFENCIFRKMHFSKNAIFENAFFENFANFWRARSRLYQNEILQVNMRLTAFFKLLRICILLHRCDSNFFSKRSV